MKKLLEETIAATREAGALTLQYFGGQYEIEDKGNGDPLTTADLAADAYLKKALLALRPDCGWLSEETVDDHQRLEREAVWIVDPIDGTREFVEGLPEYVVAVALVEAGAPTLAVIFNPAQDQLYAAIKDGGTFLNGQRVFCSELQTLDKAVATVSLTSAKSAPSAASPINWRWPRLEPATSISACNPRTSGISARATYSSVRPAAICSNAAARCAHTIKGIH
jgi:myo-inositol-1(or 4)-monophosphatase